MTKFNRIMRSRPTVVSLTRGSSVSWWFNRTPQGGRPTRLLAPVIWARSRRRGWFSSPKPNAQASAGTAVSWEDLLTLDLSDLADQGYLVDFEEEEEEEPWFISLGPGQLEGFMSRYPTKEREEFLSSDADDREEALTLEPGELEWFLSQDPEIREMLLRAISDRAAASTPTLGLPEIMKTLTEAHEAEIRGEFHSPPLPPLPPNPKSLEDFLKLTPEERAWFLSLGSEDSEEEPNPLSDSEKEPVPNLLPEFIKILAAACEEKNQQRLLNLEADNQKWLRSLNPVEQAWFNGLDPKDQEELLNPLSGRVADSAPKPAPRTLLESLARLAEEEALREPFAPDLKWLTVEQYWDIVFAMRYWSDPEREAEIGPDDRAEVIQVNTLGEKVFTREENHKRLLKSMRKWLEKYDLTWAHRRWGGQLWGPDGENKGNLPRVRLWRKLLFRAG